MKNFLTALVIIALGAGVAGAQNTQVVISTNMGQIHLELFDSRAPQTVQNFLRYVDRGFYNGTIFHRVIPNFMIQGGGLVPGMREKQTAAPVRNEAGNQAPNLRGTIAMARTMDPHSATAQFFINVNDNHFLNFKNQSVQGYGYCVFGRVIHGMDVADRIVSVPTRNWGPHQNVPMQDVVITSIRRK